MHFRGGRGCSVAVTRSDIPWAERPDAIDGESSDLNIAGSLDEPFKSRTYIALTLRKQSDGVGVPVDR